MTARCVCVCGGGGGVTTKSIIIRTKEVQNVQQLIMTLECITLVSNDYKTCNSP